MQSINAFVGHSFAKTDQEVVRKFLDYFTTIQSVYPNFAWDHAEGIDLKTLSEKVLSKINGKNVFIGICTFREFAVEKTALSKSFFAEKWKVANANLEAKPSDWIIQEVGLAIGRDMKLVIFLEDGVRKPGGLFGDIEYIPFSREHPHESFGKFLEVLKMLAPINSATAAEATTPDTSKKDDSEAKDVGIETEPSPSWTMEDYDRASFHKIVENDSAGLEKINTAFKASIFAQGDGLSVWEARQEFLSPVNGGSPDVEKLKRLSTEHPTNSKILYFLANAYEDYKDHSNSAKKFEEASAHTKDPFEALQSLGQAAEQHARDGKMPRALELLEKIKTDGEGDSRTEVLVIGVATTLAEIEKDEDLDLALLEKGVEGQPGDITRRFIVAYKHSQTSNSDMALHHYLKIPTNVRSSATWNNLGVCFGQIQMPVRTVRSFRKAVDENETLAMSNLGFKFLNAGFFDEAKAECDKALKIEGYHKNVPLLATRLQEVTDEEDKKLDDALDKVKTKAVFYRELGNRAILKSPKAIVGNWQSPDCELEVILNGTDIRMTGSYQRPTNPLVAGLGMGMLSTSLLQKIEYNGRLRGRIIVAVVSRKGDGQAGTVLALGLDSGKALMYFNDDESELHVMEGPQSTSPSFYVLKRIP